MELFVWLYRVRVRVTYLGNTLYSTRMQILEVVRVNVNFGQCSVRKLGPAILVDISTCITSVSSQYIYMTLQEANDTSTGVKAGVCIHHNPCTGIRPWKKNIQESHRWHTPLKITMVMTDSVLLPPSVEEDISLSVELKQRGQRIHFEETPKSSSEQVSFGWIMHHDTKPKWFRNGLTNTTSLRCW